MVINHESTAITAKEEKLTQLKTKKAELHHRKAVKSDFSDFGLW